MKNFNLIIIMIMLLPINLLANFNKSAKHAKAKQYFLALSHITSKNSNNNLDLNSKKILEALLNVTGTFYFQTYSDTQLELIDTPTTNLLMAKRLMYSQKHKNALSKLQHFPKKHRLFPESLLLKASIYEQLGAKKSFLKTLKLCIGKSREKAKKSGRSVKLYYQVIEQSCIINKARYLFKTKRYQQALEQYNLIPKTSFQWPYLLLEKAWSHYYLQNFNRSLGILVTYNSPLLKSYFTPEAEVLKALNYLKLCHFDDANNVVNDYYKSHTKNSRTLKSIIQNENDPKYFFNLMFTPIRKSEKKHQFLRNVITQISKRVKFKLDTNAYRKLKKELKQFKTSSKDRKRLLIMKNNLEEQINHYAKVSFYRFINEIHSLSSEMMAIRLELLSQKRAYTYSGYKSKSEKEKNQNITRKSTQEYWEFKKEFWADELGDYSYQLESLCK